MNYLPRLSVLDAGQLYAGQLGTTKAASTAA